MHFSIIIIIIIILFCEIINKMETTQDHNGTYNEKWGYKSGYNFKSPFDWKYLSNTDCGGQRQSPIDIRTEKAIFKSNLHPFIIKEIKNENSSTRLEKHFSSIYLLFDKNYELAFGRNHCLTPVSLHWHWGSDDTKGSEHRLNGIQFPIEGHLVSYSCDKFKSNDSLTDKSDIIYVIGFFYKIGQPNSIFNRITEAINQLITTDNESVSLNEIHLRQLLPRNLSRYYRYEGSLTTPPCSENVIWSVMDEVQYLSKEQLDVFRHLKFEPPENGYMVDNFRPIDTFSFTNRVVYSSFVNGKTILNSKKFTVLVMLLFARSLM